MTGKLIDDAPTIIEAEKVDPTIIEAEKLVAAIRGFIGRGVIVRCRDCTYYDGATVNSKGFLICPASGMEITDEDFCSYGERRDEAKCNFYDYVRDRARKPVTHADRIRAMTDEELAEFFTFCDSCVIFKDECRTKGYACKQRWIDWLKQEVDDDCIHRPGEGL